MHSPKETRLWTFGRAVAGIAAVAVIATGCAKPDKDPHASESWSNSHASEGECEIAELPETGDGQEAVTGDDVSPSGEYIVGTTNDGATLWQDGAEPIQIDSEHGVFEPTDVNSSGVVIGNSAKGSSQEDSPVNAWKWQNGEFTELKVPDDDANSTATSINDQGDIVGGSGGLSDEGLENNQETDAPEREVLWASGSTLGVEIDAEEGGLEGLTEITEDGTVVGTVSEGEDEAPRPWAWKPEGSATKPPSVPAEEGDEEDPPGISRVTGNLVEWHEGGEDGKYYRWDQSDIGEPEEFTVSSDLISPRAMDSAGRVYSRTPVDDYAQAPAVQVGDSVSELPSFDDPVDDGANEVYETSDDGEVLIGQSQDGEVMRTAMWTCDW